MNCDHNKILIDNSCESNTQSPKQNPKMNYKYCSLFGYCFVDILTTKS